MNQIKLDKETLLEISKLAKAEYHDEKCKATKNAWRYFSNLAYMLALLTDEEEAR